MFEPRSSSSTTAWLCAFLVAGCQVSTDGSRSAYSRIILTGEAATPLRGECKLSMMPADGGCEVISFDDSPDEAARTHLACGQRYSLCTLEFHCPCPWDPMKVDAQPPGWRNGTGRLSPGRAR